MNQNQLKKLKALFRGQIHVDQVFRETFATAACLYRIPPAAAAMPQDQEDLAALIEFAAQEKIPLTPRGAGSSVAGQALGKGIVISFTKHLNRLLELRPEEKLVRVEPGIICAELNRRLKTSGLFFPPDPSSANYCTLGGMLANNSSGAHSLFYGPTQNYVQEMEVLLADGSCAVLGKNKFELIEARSSWSKNLRAQIDALFQNHGQALARDRPSVKNASGYLLWGAMEQDGINYARLLCGSEGTLAVILSAWLSLKDLPPFQSAGLLYFKELEPATRAVLKLRELKPQAIEIMDYNFIKLVRENYPELRPMLDEKSAYMLLCEFQGATPDQALEKIRDAGSRMVETERLAYKSIIAQDDRERELLWKVRQSASPILYRLGQGLVRFIEDIVIPPQKFPDGLKRLQEIFTEFQTFAPVMGHAGEGNLHLNPGFNPANQDDLRRMQLCADQVYKMVISLGGSISGEHGDGILRAPYVQSQFPNAFPVFQELKKIFDPQQILNPGKILAPPGLIPLDNIKYWMPERPQSPLQKIFAQENSIQLIFRCHGCGLCRTYCPGSTGFPQETALPRSKVSIARGLAQGLVDEDALASPEMDTLLRACFSCQRCLNLCPTQVQVAKIVEQLKNYRQQKRLPNIREIILDRAGDMLCLLGKMPKPLLALPASKIVRTAARIVRINPEAASFFNPNDPERLKQAGNISAPESLSRSELKIIFFPGCLERWLEPEALLPTLQILQNLRADCEMLDDLCCGLPASQDNFLHAQASAKKIASRVLPVIDRGGFLLSNCPSCLSFFRHAYPSLLPGTGEKIARAALSIYELAEKTPLPVKVSARNDFVYHRACHIIGLGEPDPALQFLRTVGLKPRAVVEQCCGSAGSFELKSENAEASRKIASALKAELEKSGARLVVSACGLCRRKIQALGFEVRSPLEMAAGQGEER